MQINTGLNLLILTLAVIVTFLSLISYAAGRMGRKLAGIVVFIVLVTAMLVGTGIQLFPKIGPLVLGVIALPTFAIDMGMLGGYFVGKARHGGKPQNGLAAIVIVLLACDLFGAYSYYGHVVQILKDTGAIKDTTVAPPQDAPATASSAQNLKDLYAAFSQYAGSNEGVLPPAEKWMENEDLKGYIQKDEWLHDPAVSTGHDEKFGYAYNDAVAGKKLKEIPDAAKTPLLYESSNTAKSAHDAVTSLPKPGRHNGKNEILFCDGHVESVAPK